MTADPGHAAPSPVSHDGPSGTELVFAVDGVELVGTSIAALATAFAVDRFRVAVDMGRCSPLLASQDTVLLTHCHSDHVAGLIAWLSAHTRRHRRTETRIAVPAERRDPLLRSLAIWPDLDGVRRRVDLAEVIVGVAPGDELPLADGATARAFDVEHNTPSVGWQLVPRGASRAVISFSGDGTAAPFRRDPSLLDAEIAVVDCTFVDPGTRLAARLSRHAHLDDWRELLPDLACRWLVLSHLPPEATADSIHRALGDGVDAGPRIVPWCRPS